MEYYEPSYSRYLERPLNIRHYKKLEETIYYSLISEDEINLHKLDNLKRQEFKYSLRNILADLNYLLYLDHEEFWKQMEVIGQEQLGIESDEGEKNCNDSLRRCLESCLSCLGRRGYSKIYAKQLKGNETLPPEEQLEQYYCFVKIVLFIYHRISCASTQRQKEIVSENWYLDTCKAFELCSIYGEVNHPIVKTIIQNMVNINKQLYLEDFTHVLAITLKRIKILYREFYIYPLHLANHYKPQKINKYHQRLSDHQEDIEDQNAANLPKNTESQRNILICTVMKELFAIYDMLMNLTNILLHFSPEQKLMLAKDAVLYKCLIHLFVKFENSVSKQWKIDYLWKSLPPIIYEEFIKEDEDRRQRQKISKQICRNFMKNIIIFSKNNKKQRVFTKQALQIFNKKDQNYKYLSNSEKFQNNFIEQFYERNKEQSNLKLQFLKMIPSFKQFKNLVEFDKVSDIKLNLYIRLEKQMKEYADDPEFDEISSDGSICQSQKLKNKEDHHNFSKKESTAREEFIEASSVDKNSRIFLKKQHFYQDNISQVSSIRGDWMNQRTGDFDFSFIDLQDEMKKTFQNKLIDSSFTLRNEQNEESRGFQSSQTNTVQNVESNEY